MIPTTILEQRVVDIKAKIKRLEERLFKAEEALHKRRLLDLGWAGCIARSDRLPGGIVVTDVVFRSWAPTEPQMVIGHRVGNDCPATIPVTSAGFKVHDANRKGAAA